MYGQIIAAALFGVASLAFLIWIWWGYSRFKEPPHQSGFEPSVTKFAEAAKTFSGTDGAAVVADRVDKLLKSYDDANVTLEAKANTILGFLGAGVGVVSVLSTGDRTGVPAFTPLLAAGFVLVLVSLAHCILALWARVDYVLDLEPFCQLSVMGEANAKARLTAEMAHSALLVQYYALRQQMLKNAAVKGAQVFFAFGAAALALNLLFAVAATPPDKPVAANCKIGQSPALSVTCQEVK